ncbi:MAG: DNA-binding protein WhiA [Synergistaceae bacterium]|nr:DNA-binding protein WhiA [Synergistaceae bacterium]
MEKNLRLGKLWDEWLTFENDSQLQNDFEISGILMGMKCRDLSEEKFFYTNRLRTARRLLRVWPLSSYYEKFNFTPAISLITSKNQKPHVKISFPAFTQENFFKIPTNLKSAWPWLKGLWGSTGGFYFPKVGYYMTLIISDEKISKLAARFLKLTKLSWSVHRNEFTLRNHDDIMTFLCNTGLIVSALEFDKMAMIRSVRNRVNVVRNYEAANIARSVRAASQQLELAKKFLAINATLPKNLRELAELRINYPDDTLEELGKKLNPAIKKSAVQYRWNKIKEKLSISPQ